MNIKLADAVPVNAEIDPLGRAFKGWDPTKDDEQHWRANRGRWRMNVERVEQESLATLSYGGVIRLVAEIIGTETVSDVPRPGFKTALIGRVLSPGDPLRDALVGQPAPGGRNPVGYFDTSRLEGMSLAERAKAPRSQVNAFLLTQNPARWTWDDNEWTRAKAATDVGGFYRGDWSTGNRVRDIEPGDVAFLLRQGQEPRGIYARGSFASRPFSAGHWDGSDRDATYAHVDWEEMLEPADVLPLDLLKQRFPQQHWDTQSGGNRIRDDVFPALRALWEDHSGRLSRTPCRTRQGWQFDSERRKLVEDAAQDRLMEHFRRRGWDVKDVRRGNPFDAVATKAGRLLYLEAKGTETAGRSVIVTRGEVDHVRGHPDQCVMGVLSDVRFGTDGTVAKNSGTLRVFDWTADEAELTARAFDFLPMSTARWEG